MIPSLWRRLVRGERRVAERGDWSRFAGAGWRDRIMRQPVTDDFHAKQGRSTGRWVLQDQGERLSVYLKRHYRLPWWRGVLATLFPRRAWSPARQEEEHLLWAEGEGLPVPRIVASAEYVGPWFRLQSALVVEELVDMLPLHQAIPLAAHTLGPEAFHRWKAALAAEMARLAHELHRRRRFHKDLYLCHFYLPRADITAAPFRDHDFRGRLHLIDLHRLAHHRWTWPVWLVKDLGQLLYSSDVEGVTARDRVRFWRLYRAGARRTRRVRWLEAVIRFKWQRYRRHNDKRRARTARADPFFGKEAA